MVITIASPDKVSIAMFVSLMRHCFGNDLFVAETHSLMTKESVELYLKSIFDIPAKPDKILISYYARKQVNVDPVKIIPEKLMADSDLVVWINLYSTDWIVVKDIGNIVAPYLERWKRNVDRIDSMGN